MKLGIPSTLRMGPDFQMDGLSFAVTGTGGRYQIGVDTFQHFDIIIDAPQGEVFALPPHSRPEPQGQKNRYQTGILSMMQIMRMVRAVAPKWAFNATWAREDWA